MDLFLVLTLWEYQAVGDREGNDSGAASKYRRRSAGDILFSILVASEVETVCLPFSADRPYDDDYRELVRRAGVDGEAGAFVALADATARAREGSGGKRLMRMKSQNWEEEKPTTICFESAELN